jgi:hypothetical protein
MQYKETQIMQLLPNPILIYDGAVAYAPAVTSLSFTGGTLSPFPGGVQVSITGTSGGTVTSVGLSLPSIFAVSGSPVVGAGTLTGTLNTQAANTFFSGPTTGAAAIPTFRTLVAEDLTTALPSQAGNAGKFLQTDGALLSWQTAGGGGGVGPAVANQVAIFNTATSVTGYAGFQLISASNSINHVTLTGGATVGNVGPNSFLQGRATAGISHGVTGSGNFVIADYNGVGATDVQSSYSYIIHQQNGGSITDISTYSCIISSNADTAVLFPGSIRSFNVVTGANTSTNRVKTVDSFTVTKTTSNAVFNAGNNTYANNCFANFVIGGTNNTVTIGNNQLNNSFLNVQHDSVSNADQLSLNVNSSFANIVATGVGQTSVTNLNRSHLTAWKTGGQILASTIDTSFTSLAAAGSATNNLTLSSVTGSFLRARNENSNTTLQSINDSFIATRQIGTVTGSINISNAESSFVTINNSFASTVSFTSVRDSVIQIYQNRTGPGAPPVNTTLNTYGSNIRVWTQGLGLPAGTHNINIGTAILPALSINATIDDTGNSGAWLASTITVDNGVNSSSAPMNVLLAAGMGEPTGQPTQIIGRVRTAISYGDANVMNFDYSNSDPNGNNRWPGFLFGRGLITRAPYETVIGRWNTDIVYGTTITIDGTLPAFRIGGGTSHAARADVFRIDQDGKHQTFAAEKHKTRTSAITPETLSARTDYSLGFTNTGNKTINLPVLEDGLEYKVTCTVGSGNYTVNGGASNIIYAGVSGLSQVVAVALGGTLEIFAVNGVWIMKYLA